MGVSLSLPTSLVATHIHLTIRPSLQLGVKSVQAASFTQQQGIVPHILTSKVCGRPPPHSMDGGQRMKERRDGTGQEDTGAEEDDEDEEGTANGKLFD